jgi:lipoprotein-anchoring transpeptidase ErfK/SrfK
MNVLESRTGRPLRLRPWVLLVGAAVVLAVVVLALIHGASSPAHSGSAGGASTDASSKSAGGAGTGSSGAAAASFYLKTTTPAAGAQNVAPNTTISLTFSAPVSLHKAAPVLSPNIAGKWVRTNPTTLSYALASPLIPSTQVTVTIPGGAHGLRSANGATLTSSNSVAFGVAAGDTLRLQQLLAQLNYLPVGFTPSGPAPDKADLAQDQPGTFSWRWPGLPSQLTSQWTQGTENEITKAAVEAFETQNNIGVDGIAGPTVWTALINDLINHKPSATPYVYVLVNKVVPQNLTLWNNGVAQYVGFPVNSGAPGADTTDGTFAVFEHVRYSDMKGTNVDGSTYDDPNVPYASYFNGGDALHGFIRSSYGTPQSNGCVEMSYADAALIWPLTPIGTLVTVEGPDFGTAPPPATTTTTAPAPTTTTTPPAPAAAPPPPAPTTTAPPPVATTAPTAAPG